ncbi:3-hydroxyisobutyrate dehydrogenase [Neofusicoccum parvum]|uniref:3-hydroxyisobutyrate dehydrogenase n=1 Tax=Neofusicoccum parvum TaxID=310453 RepID=A0ACB5RXC3_9PEZI|nr:3-hydroxyisobutyrate dehydrogenase [Neofusicoccum parvum]
MPTPGTSIWLPAGISATIVTTAVVTIVWRFRIPSTALIFSSHTLATASIAARQTVQAAAFPLDSGIAWFFFLLLPAMLLSLQTVIQPFLWTLVAVNVPDPDARLATLGAVFAGYAVGKGFCVGTAIYASPWRWAPVAFVQQLAIGGLVVFYMWRNGEAKGREEERRDGRLGVESGEEGGEEGLEGKQFRYAY